LYLFYSYALGDHSLFDKAYPDELVGGLSTARFLGICDFINEATWKLQRWSMDPYEAVLAYQKVSELNTFDFINSFLIFTSVGTRQIRI